MRERERFRKKDIKKGGGGGRGVELRGKWPRDQIYLAQIFIISFWSPLYKLSLTWYLKICLKTHNLLIIWSTPNMKCNQNYLFYLLENLGLYSVATSNKADIWNIDTSFQIKESEKHSFKWAMERAWTLIFVLFFFNMKHWEVGRRKVSDLCNPSIFIN